MTQVSPHVPTTLATTLASTSVATSVATTAANGSRLVRLLSELTVSDVEISPYNFAERLAQLFGFGESISLSKAHGKLQTMAFEPTTVAHAAITEQFLAMRTSLIQAVMLSFDPGDSTSRIKIPSAKATLPPGEAKAYQAYLKYYVAQQRQFELKIQELRSRVRRAASGLSPALAQLCALDAMLGEPLSAHSRKVFAVIPKLLGQRFEHWIDQYQQALAGQPDNQHTWAPYHEHFCQEIQGTLLAEIEDRLLPVLGLLEAINEDSAINYE